MKPDNRLSRLLKGKIDRNQWLDISDTYRNLVTWSWEEIQREAPAYFNRLSYSVEHSRGKVLEIGAGIGNMTKWLVASDSVEMVYAVDGFSEAIEELKKLQLPRVSMHLFKVEDVSFPSDLKFDTFVMCEVLEHIYQDEEMSMLKNLKQNLSGETKYILSTPVGWMDEPFHVRSFDKEQFIRHVEKYYGPLIQVDYTAGYSQTAYGTFRS